jgi:hypothetical protein
MHQKTRNVIRSATGQLGFQIHNDIDRFIRLSSDRHGRNDRNKYDVLQKLWIEITARNRGRVISAIDPSSGDIAACVIVWDFGTAYYWLSARRDDDLGRKANPALLFEALSLAKKMNLNFDADGYATIESGQFLSKFGLPVTLRAIVEKRGDTYQLLKPVKDYFRPMPPEV